MKRLNKKGFTLVELLAVIIILAVVVGITIPTVLNAVSGAKTSQFENAAESAAGWFDRQYQLAAMTDTSIATADKAYTDFCGGSVAVGGSLTCTITGADEAAKTAMRESVIVALGLKVADIADVAVTFTNGRSCVVLTSKTGGNYTTTEYPAGTTSTAGSGCVSSSLGLKKPA